MALRSTQDSRLNLSSFLLYHLSSLPTNLGTSIDFDICFPAEPTNMLTPPRKAQRITDLENWRTLDTFALPQFQRAKKSWQASHLTLSTLLYASTGPHRLWPAVTREDQA